MPLQRLALAERHVLEGATHVAYQRAHVARLSADDVSRAAQDARDLLRQFELLQDRFVADRDRLRDEARQSSSRSATG